MVARRLRMLDFSGNCLISEVIVMTTNILAEDSLTLVQGAMLLSSDPEPEITAG